MSVQAYAHPYKLQVTKIYFQVVPTGKEDKYPVVPTGKFTTRGLSLYIPGQAK